jgi:hypothetical protein
MNKLHRKYSRLGSTREQQRLLSHQGQNGAAAGAADSSGPGGSTVVSSGKAAAGSSAQTGWWLQLHRLVAVNSERSRRLVERMVQFFMMNLPSPFQVSLHGPPIIRCCFIAIVAIKCCFIVLAVPSQ